ncbi:MAG TPA: ABC transporter ATP-binding protein [Rhodothermales bacterium]|nr:ABC transporter ATP-binding protein [Rhodothermales bacterium]
MIEIQNLYKAFSGLPVLTDVSLTIEDAKTFAVIGASGSGKSVLMKNVVGLMKPDRGTILVDGVDISTLSYGETRKLREQFGVLFQGGALFDSMNAFDNVAFPLRMITEMREPEIRKRVEECLETVHLPEAGSKMPSELSGGMQKRVALARAVALQPKYIFYDEPTSGLDPITSNAINELIKDLDARLGITGIVITHDMHSCLHIADRIGFLHEGNMHWVGTVDELHSATDETLLDFVKASEYRIGP